MPNSHPDSQHMLTELVLKHASTARTVVDVGPGVGTYAERLRTYLPDANFVAVEKWAPYIPNFALETLYDKIIVADAAWLNWDRLLAGVGPSLVIFGDVIEHMTENDALAAWDGARCYAQWIGLALPIVHYPQDAQFGNPYEKHVTQWDHNKVTETFPGIYDFERAPIVGAYMAGPE